MGLVFHRLIQRDLQSVLAYYRDQGGAELADRFYTEFERLVTEVGASPERFHFVAETLRRVNFRKFPYHLLYRVSGDTVRVLVLRHHRRDPRHGLERR